VLQLAITLPDSIKIGSHVSTELQSTFVFEPIRVFALGVVIHVAWRTVGGVARAMNTLGAFVYVYSLMSLLSGCSQVLSTGILRMWSPKIADDLFQGTQSGRVFESVQQSSDFFSKHPVAITFLWGLAICPMFLVPFVCWGAFRVQNRVSRMRGWIAASLSLILGILAWAVTVSLSYFTIGPG